MTIIDISQIENLLEYNRNKTNVSFYESLVNCALWKAYDVEFGYDESYCKKSIKTWPLSKFQWENSIKHYKQHGTHLWEATNKYKTYQEYVDSDDYVINTFKSDDYGMNFLYSLLDNFHSYYRILKYQEYIICISLGSSWTGCNYMSNGGYYSSDHCTEGFALIIDSITNDLVCISFGEDDGNFWVEKVVNYSDLNIRDHAEIISMINELPEHLFYDKNALIEKLWI